MPATGGAELPAGRAELVGSMIGSFLAGRSGGSTPALDAICYEAS